VEVARHTESLPLTAPAPHPVDTVPPGHSSMPPFETNVGILSNAMARLERTPCPAHVDMYSRHLKRLAPELSLPMRVVVANPWLFSRVLKRVMLAKSTTASILRTTTAITILRAGAKINAIPGLAVAYVNHRIHPSDRDGETVLAHDRQVVADPRVKVEFSRDSNGELDYLRPSPETSADAPGFKLLARTVRRVFDNAPVMPSAMVGNTDTRWYWDLTDESECPAARDPRGSRDQSTLTNPAHASLPPLASDHGLVGRHQDVPRQQRAQYVGWASRGRACRVRLFALSAVPPGPDLSSLLLRSHLGAVVPCRHFLLRAHRLARRPPQLTSRAGRRPRVTRRAARAAALARGGAADEPCAAGGHRWPARARSRPSPVATRCRTCRTQRCLIVARNVPRSTRSLDAFSMHSAQQRQQRHKQHKQQNKDKQRTPSSSGSQQQQQPAAATSGSSGSSGSKRRASTIASI
jgi:hypothetical protein